MTEYRFLFTGSRKWGQEGIVDIIMGGLSNPGLQPSQIIIVHGANGIEDEATGNKRNDSSLDAIADLYARMYGYNVERVFADWVKLGKPAGPIRNQLMIDKHSPFNMCFAFPTAESRGTWDCIKRARIAKIPIYIIQYGNSER